MIKIFEKNREIARLNVDFVRITFQFHDFFWVKNVFEKVREIARFNVEFVRITFQFHDFFFW